MDVIAHTIEDKFSHASIFLRNEVARGIQSLARYKTNIIDGLKPVTQALGELLNMLHPLAADGEKKDGEKKQKLTLNSVPLFKKTLAHCKPYQELFGKDEAKNGGIIGGIVDLVRSDPEKAEASITALLAKAINAAGAGTHANTYLTLAASKPLAICLHTHPHAHAVSEVLCYHSPPHTSLHTHYS